LGGQGMKIVINKQELEEHVVNLLKTIPGNKLLLDHYLDGAIEAEADAICDGENVYIIGLWAGHWRTLEIVMRHYHRLI
jgi:carbamoyl-phosphate synthase large subunit